MLRDAIGTNFPALKFSLRMVDVFALFASGELSRLLRFGQGQDGEAAIYSVLLYFCSALAFILFDKFDFYDSWRGRSRLVMCVKIACAWAGMLFAGLMFSFLLHQTGTLSRLWLLYWFLIGTAFILTLRLICFAILRRVRRRGFNQKTVVIVGYGEIGTELHDRALQHDWYGYEVLAIHAAEEDRHKIDERIDRRSVV